MKLERAFIYPVKSLRGVEVASLELDDLGPVGDRRWMLVDDAGRFVTQRQFPKLAVMTPRFSDEQLQLEFEGALSPLTPRFARPSPRGRGRRVTVWGDSFEALDCGDDLARWLSEVLGASLRLVQFSPDVRREVDPRYATDAQTGVRSDMAAGSQAAIYVDIPQAGITLGTDGIHPTFQGHKDLADAAWAWIIDDSKTWLSPPSLISGGIEISRGSTRGAGTMARPESRPNASTPSSCTMKLRLLLTSSGNGWVGSSPIGVTSGATSSRK